MSQNLQNFAKFQKFQLDNLVDFEKCCKTHIFLQKSEPIQPKTNNILPKFGKVLFVPVAAALVAGELVGFEAAFDASLCCYCVWVFFPRIWKQKLER